MQDYTTWPYPELKKECAKRGLGGAGTADSLITKLVNNDLGRPPPEPESKAIPERYQGLQATDPNPDNPNYDMAGRWIRRVPQRPPSDAIQENG